MLLKIHNDNNSNNNNSHVVSKTSGITISPELSFESIQCK